MIIVKPIVPQVVCIAFVLLILAQIFFGFHSMHSISKMTFEQPFVPTSKKNSETTIKNSLQKPLFGAFVPDLLDEKSIKKSSLNLQVAGIIFSDNEKDSQVIIHMANGEEQVYQVGDKLPGNIEIKRITSQGIVVLHHGMLESLSLPKNELIFQPPAKPLIGQ